MSKKIITILLAISLLLSLTACKKEEVDVGNNGGGVYADEVVQPTEKELIADEIYERIVYEDMFTKVSIKKHEQNQENENSLISVTLGVQNKGNGHAFVSVNGLTINDKKIEHHKEIKVTDKSERLLTFDYEIPEKDKDMFSDISKIEDIDKLTFELSVYNSANANTIPVTIEYYPNNEEKNENELTVDEKILVSNDKYHIAFMSNRLTYDKLQFIVYVENKTDKNAEFTFKDISIGNEKIKKKYTKTVNAGMTSYMTIMVETTNEVLKDAETYKFKMTIPGDKENEIFTSKLLEFEIL